ncbi:MAG: signal peptidase I [Ruminococcus sp.]|nr:signal peptidase I [Ruminococcus sp.]
MKKALSIFANVLAWIVLIFALLITIMVFSSSKNNGVAHLFGYMPMAVESDSMKPTFKQGDLIICKEIDDYSTIKENDVITFWTTIQGQRVKNTHRIVEVLNDDGNVKYVTKGDNNSVKDDDVISQGAIIGKWTEVKLPVIGKIMDFLRTKTGFFICIVLPMAIFFLFELYKFIATIIEAKRPEPVEVDEEEIKRRAIEEYLAAQKQAGGAAEKVEAAAEKAEAKVEAAAEKAEALAEAAETAAAEETKAE